MDAIPWTVANDFMEHRCQQRMDHDLYGLRPNHRFFQQHPTVNDALANLICSGYITISVGNCGNFDQYLCLGGCRRTQEQQRCG
jgi:dimethylaniline monooxygenase (N-oxide forming)